MKVKIDRIKVKIMAKTKTKPAPAARARARSGAKRRRPAPARRRPRAVLSFNHAMIYAADVPRALAFYELLGFETLQTQLPYYARLRTGAGTTIALHMAEPGKPVAADGVRLYFETPALAALCRSLERAGVVFTKPPARQPWGWTHAYLNDPDGHEVSLYWAGKQRLAKAGKS